MIGAVNYVGGRSLLIIESFLTMSLPTNDHSVARGFSFLPFLPACLASYLLMIPEVGEKEPSSEARGASEGGREGESGLSFRS